MGCYLIENWIKIWKKSMKYRPLRIMVGCNDITRTEIELDFKKDESELSWEKLAESDKKIGKLVKGELCYYCCKEVNDNIIKCNYCNNISYCSKECKNKDFYKHQNFCFNKFL